MRIYTIIAAVCTWKQEDNVFLSFDNLKHYYNALIMPSLARMHKGWLNLTHAWLTLVRGIKNNNFSARNKRILPIIGQFCVCDESREFHAYFRFKPTL